MVYILISTNNKWKRFFFFPFKKNVIKNIKNKIFFMIIKLFFMEIFKYLI